MSEFDVSRDCAHRIYLIGFMGSGKSTVARKLAKTVGFACLDLDEVIEKEQGKRIKDIFDQDGERAFRALETQALAATREMDRVVVSTGGGVISADENRALLNNLGAVVYLHVSAEEAIARVGDTDSRPMLAGSSATLAATDLLAARKSLYRAVADITIDTMGITPEQVARQIKDKIRVCA